MGVETMSRRLNEIERAWKQAAAPQRESYLSELSAISHGLERVTGLDAERAEWLGRRVDRAVRTINLTLDAG